MLTGTYDAVVVGARCAGSPTAMLLAQKGDPHPRRAHRRALRMAGGGEFLANRSDIEGNFLAAIDLAPEFAECVHAATRESKFVGSADLPGYVRKPFGPGWALMGDAGYHKNPITAMGINDAFRDAELLADALDDAFSGRRPYDEAMTGHQQARDREALPVYEFTDDFAQLRPPRPLCSSSSRRCGETRRRWTGSSACRPTRSRRRSSSSRANIAHIMGAAPAPSTGSGGSRPA
ncbi:MAG: hypothetical protein QOF86_3758, partial [Baekduia sp.]|nr:hypothetical protein [Baekduia sp.]